MALISFFTSTLLYLILSSFLSLPYIHRVECMNLPLSDDIEHVYNAIGHMRRLMQINGNVPFAPSAAGSMSSMSGMSGSLRLSNMHLPTQIPSISSASMTPSIPSSALTNLTSISSSLLSSVDPCLLNAVQLFNQSQQLCGIQLTTPSLATSQQAQAFTPQLTTSICQTPGCQQSMYQSFMSAAQCSSSSSSNANSNSATSILPSTSSNTFASAANFLQNACVTDNSNNLCVPQVLQLSTIIFTQTHATGSNTNSNPINSMLDRLCNSQCSTVLSTTSSIQGE